MATCWFSGYCKQENSHKPQRYALIKQKQTMRNIIFTGLILALALISCDKEDEDSQNKACGNIFTAEITSIDLQNFMYKTSSYWVYVDSVDNTTDSISVENFEHGFIEDICGNSFEIHSFETISHNSIEQTDYVVVKGGLFKGFDGTPYSGTQIYDDFDLTSSMTNYQIEKYDSYFIYDRFYENVLRVEIETDATENNNKSIYFINSEFGFLRHDIYSNNDLISQKILMRKNIVR